MSVALMGNLPNTASTDETTSPTWEQARLGHCVIMVELINRLKALRKGAVSSLVLPSNKSGLSKFTGCCIGRAYRIRDLAGISASYPA